MQEKAGTNNIVPKLVLSNKGGGEARQTRELCCL